MKTRTRKPQWKKDELMHLKHHGLAMKFTDTVKQAVIDGMKGRDGTYQIEAGKSHIQLKVIGRVTFWEMFDAVGHRRTSKGAHYWDDSTMLKHSISNHSEDEAAALGTLTSITEIKNLKDRIEAEIKAARKMLASISHEEANREIVKVSMLQELGKAIKEMDELPEILKRNNPVGTTMSDLMVIIKQATNSLIGISAD